MFTRTLVILGVAAAAALTAVYAAAGATPGNASLLIRHQVRDCHAWSLDGGAFKASQTTTLARGGWMRVVNDDVMSHALVKTSGPAVTYVNLKTGTMMGMHGPAAPGAMTHMGASTKIVFSKAGVYRFSTKSGEDYMPGMKTIGEDNVLRLTVKVS